MIHSVLINLLLFQKKGNNIICDNENLYHGQMYGMKYIIDLICILQVSSQYICYYLFSQLSGKKHIFLLSVNLK